MNWRDRYRALACRVTRPVTPTPLPRHSPPLAPQKTPLFGLRIGLKNPRINPISDHPRKCPAGNLALPGLFSAPVHPISD